MSDEKVIVLNEKGDTLASVSEADEIAAEEAEMLKLAVSSVGDYLDAALDLFDTLDPKLKEVYKVTDIAMLIERQNNAQYVISLLDEIGQIMAVAD